MAEATGIEWADSTFNPWVGCTRISPACDNCYAESWARRAGTPELWNGNLRRTSEKNWNLPRRWNREAAATGSPRRVFCASLADVFDNQAEEIWRADLWTLIRETPALTWLLLTKRPQNVAKMLPPGWSVAGWPNVWLGTTAENEAHYQQRWRHISAVPAALRFLSYEPALGPIGNMRLWDEGAPEWVIVGGESGLGARPMHPVWARDARDQCTGAGVPFLFKQWGEWAPPDVMTIDDVPQIRCQKRAFSHPELVHVFGDGLCMGRIGKKAAGRLLDEVEHNAIPHLAEVHAHG